MPRHRPSATATGTAVAVLALSTAYRRWTRQRAYWVLIGTRDGEARYASVDGRFEMTVPCSGLVPERLSPNTSMWDALPDRLTLVDLHDAAAAK